VIAHVLQQGREDLKQQFWNKLEGVTTGFLTSEQLISAGDLS